MIASVVVFASIAISNCFAFNPGSCPEVIPGEVSSLEAIQGDWFVQFLHISLPNVITPKCLITSLNNLDGTNFTYTNSFIMPNTGDQSSTSGIVVANPQNFAVWDKIPSNSLMPIEKQIILAATDDILITTTCMNVPVGHYNTVVGHSRKEHLTLAESEHLLQTTSSFDAKTRQGGVAGLAGHLKPNRINC